MLRIDVDCRQKLPLSTLKHSLSFINEPPEQTRAQSCVLLFVQAATDGCANALTILLSHGLEVDAENDDGNTALHLASRHGMAGAARALAEAFPDEEIKNHRGFTAVDEATAAGRTQCTNCIRDFSRRGKLEAIEVHCKVERDRLETLRRHKV